MSPLGVSDGEVWAVATMAAALYVRSAPWARFRFSELVSDAAVGVMEAAARWDPERGVPFRAFALRRARGAIIDEQRRTGVRDRQGREREAVLSLDALVAGTAAGHDIVAARWDGFREVDVRDLLRHLDARQRRIVVGYYWLGLTQAQIGAREGVSEARVGQIIKASLGVLRESLAA